MKRNFIKGFFRGFYITVLALGVLTAVALGTQLAQENTQRIGYGESCLPVTEGRSVEITCILCSFVA